MVETRKFGGKVYNKYTWHGTKSLANKRAKELRDSGKWLVRIVKTRGRYGEAGRGYTLFTRKR